MMTIQRWGKGSEKWTFPPSTCKMSPDTVHSGKCAAVRADVSVPWLVKQTITIQE